MVLVSKCVATDVFCCGATLVIVTGTLVQFLPRIVAILMDHLVNMEYGRSHDKSTSKVCALGNRNRAIPLELDALLSKCASEHEIDFAPHLNASAAE